MQFSITDADGRQTTWAFTGVGRVSKELCRVILSCGLVVALIVGPVILVLAHNSVRDKVVSALGGLVVAVLLGIGAKARRWLRGRSRKRLDKAPAGDADRG